MAIVGVSGVSMQSPIASTTRVATPSVKRRFTIDEIIGENVADFRPRVQRNCSRSPPSPSSSSDINLADLRMSCVIGGGQMNVPNATADWNQNRVVERRPASRHVEVTGVLESFGVDRRAALSAILVAGGQTLSELRNGGRSSPVVHDVDVLWQATFCSRRNDRDRHTGESDVTMNIFFLHRFTRDDHERYFCEASNGIQNTKVLV
jgi:hypothetical protein